MSAVLARLAPCAFPWTGGAAAAWRARLAFAAMALLAWQASASALPLLAIQLAFSALGASAMGRAPAVRIWSAGLLLAPWLAVALGNAAVVERLAHAFAQALPLSDVLLARDVLAVAICWPVAVHSAAVMGRR